MESNENQPHDLPRVSKGKMAAILAIVVLLFAAAFVARFVPLLAHERELRAQADQAENAPPIVNVSLPQPQAIQEELNLPADVQPMAQTAIYSRVDGFLGHWYVDIGDHVEKGQLLAEIDAPDTDAELDQQRAALLQANANVTKAQSDLQLANATYERYHGLLATGSVTQQDLDTRQSTASQAAAEKAAADAAVKSAQAMVDRLTVQQGFEKIYAPFSGTITFRNYDNGARITASDTAAGHELFDIADTDRLRIYVYVPQAYVTLIQQNQPVGFISQRNYGTRQFVGYVARTAGTLDPATRTLRTELDFDNKDHLLWAGMYGEVHISAHRNHPTLTVPTAAMMFEADGTQLAVVDGDNHVHFKKVTVGQDLGQRLEIVGGVSSDEKVITNPGEKLTEGAIVEIASEPQPSAPVVASADDTHAAPANPVTAAPTTRFAQTDSDPPEGGGSGGTAR
jgi:membrane fusion protein, multidrug efflux system